MMLNERAAYILRRMWLHQRNTLNQAELIDLIECEQVLQIYGSLHFTNALLPISNHSLLLATSGSIPMFPCYVLGTHLRSLEGSHTALKQKSGHLTQKRDLWRSPPSLCSMRSGVIWEHSVYYGTPCLLFQLPGSICLYHPHFYSTTIEQCYH